uniref:TLDc domain-containing protein n=1 Tax=Periophthalmus magnuspinnatus TaxID=409849 RepID=A0A3B3Z8W7_9GOBI
MSTIISSLTNDQRNKLLSLFSHAQLHLLFKASVHGFAADQFHFRCDKQGPTVCVAFNSSGFVYGAYTSKDYAQSNQNILDERAFLFSIREDRPRPIRVGVTPGQHAFVDGATGPNFGALLFLDQNTATVLSPGGATFNFTAAEMHGDNLNLTEFEVYRVQEMGGVLEKPWRIIHKRQELKNRILSYRPDVKGVKEARVLMVGPVGAGKSSFFNSISSVFRGNMTSQAITSLTPDTSSSSSGPSVPLTLCDTMGLEEAEDSGLHPDDVINICKGHVQDRYQVRPTQLWDFLFFNNKYQQHLSSRS